MAALGIVDYVTGAARPESVTGLPQPIRLLLSCNPQVMICFDDRLLGLMTGKAQTGVLIIGQS